MQSDGWWRDSYPYHYVYSVNVISIILKWETCQAARFVFLSFLLRVDESSNLHRLVVEMSPKSWRAMGVFRCAEGVYLIAFSIPALVATVQWGCSKPWGFGKLGPQLGTVDLSLVEPAKCLM